MIERWIDELFWSAATSHLVLSIVAGVLIVSLVIGFAPLLKYLSWIGPYVPVSKFVAFLAFGVLCALLDRRSADARAEIAQLRIDLSFSQLQLANQKATADHRAALAAASGAAAIDAQMKANGYEQLLATRPKRECCDLDDFDVARLQDIGPRRAGARKAGGADPPRLRGFAW